MAEPIIYVDRSEIRKGKIDELKAAIKELSDFVEAHEPQIIAYNVYITNDGAAMTVLHVHADSASLETHMKIAGPKFSKFINLIRLGRIEIYGSPSVELLEQLQAKAKLLGDAAVQVYRHHAGFSRFGIRDE
jgi:quinol monooxygenase YgiN